MPTSTRVLVDNGLLGVVRDGYCVHHLILEYLQLTITMDGGDVYAKEASSRQAQYLSRLGVLHKFVGDGINTDGIYSLVALWKSVQKLDGRVDVAACYQDAMTNMVIEPSSEAPTMLIYLEPCREAGNLLMFLVSSRLI